MGRKFVDDGRLICACRQGRLDVALVEAVNELMHGAITPAVSDAELGPATKTATASAQVSCTLVNAPL
jgi:hypothetical protein